MGEILSGGLVYRRWGAPHRNQTEIRKPDVQLGTAVAAPEIVLPELGIVDVNVVPVQRTIRVEKPDSAVKIVRDLGIQIAQNFRRRRSIRSGLLATRAAGPFGISIYRRWPRPTFDRGIQQKTFPEGGVDQQQVG